jgi:D-serine dehydratase
VKALHESGIRHAPCGWSRVVPINRRVDSALPKPKVTLLGRSLKRALQSVEISKAMAARGDIYEVLLHAYIWSKTLE